MLFFAVLLVALGVDLYTKHLTLQHLQLGEFIPMGVFDIRHVHNRGAAFGMLANNGSLFVVVAVVVLVAMLGALPRLQRAGAWVVVACALIAGGTVGNLIDRLRFGYVVDFIDFRWWPVFNVADSCICVGVGMLVWKILSTPPDSQEHPPSDSSTATTPPG